MEILLEKSFKKQLNLIKSRLWGTCENPFNTSIRIQYKNNLIKKNLKIFERFAPKLFFSQAWLYRRTMCLHVHCIHYTHKIVLVLPWYIKITFYIDVCMHVYVLISYYLIFVYAFFYSLLFAWIIYQWHTIYYWFYFFFC